jgi:hypothetical protein
MSKIQTPDPGQPLDVSYIASMARAINEISSSVTPSTYKYVTVDTASAGQQSVRTSDAKMIGGYVEVANNSTVTAGNEKSFFYDFPADFKYAPIATATPVNVGNTTAGKDVSVILKSVTTSRVEGIVKFNTSGDVSVALNLIILGIPN